MLLRHNGAVCDPARLELELDCDRQLSPRVAVQVHVNLTGLRPEELDRFQHGGDVPSVAVAADIAGELAGELQAPLVVTADEAEGQILIHPYRLHADPPPALASTLTAPWPGT
jgi:hypothetical protein